MPPNTTTRGERGDDRGAVMVEFALILPLLVMLLVGIIEFGSAYNTKLALQAAAREGARAAALGRDSGDVRDTVEAAASPHDLDASAGGSIDLSRASCPDPGDPVGNAVAVVEVTKDFTFSIPFVDLGDVELSARGVMRCGA